MSSSDDLRHAEKLKARAAGVVKTETYPANPGHVPEVAKVDDVTARYHAKVAARTRAVPAAQPQQAAAPEEAPKAEPVEAAPVTASAPDPKVDNKPADKSGKR